MRLIRKLLPLLSLAFSVKRPLHFTRTLAFFALALALAISGCQDSDPGIAVLEFTVGTEVDGQPVIAGSLPYTNEAGQAYGITRLNYYLSGFALIREDGGTVPFDDVFLIDGLATNGLAAEALIVPTQVFLEEVPEGTYTGLRFLIGLAGAQNEKGQLENSVENTNMFWPDLLGGGYHYMILEGQYSDGETVRGYNTHTGRVIVDGTLQKIEYFVTIETTFPGTRFGDRETWAFGLSMNVNEWYRNPNTYAFPESPFIMSNHERQAMLKANGHNVMTVTGPVLNEEP